MRCAVFVGSSQQPAWSETLDTSTSQMISVEVDLPPGTTQITLDVANASPAAYGDVVWVDPRVEAANASLRLPGRRPLSRDRNPEGCPQYPRNSSATESHGKRSH